MSKYDEQTEAQTITSYRTPASVAINMGVNGNPSITFRENVMVEVNGSRTSSKFSRELFKEVTPGNGNTSFDIIRESDGQVLGNITYAQLKHALYGLYVHVASETDS